MGSPGAGSSGGGHECSFKILLIGDSSVGKSSLLVSFVAAAQLDDDIAPTIGTPPSIAHRSPTRRHHHHQHHAPSRYPRSLLLCPPPPRRSKQIPRSGPLSLFLP
jgi:hypothetical protein